MSCKVRWLLVLAMLAAGLVNTLSAQAGEFPNIKYVGIIPLQWQGEFPTDPAFPAFRERMEKDFPNLVRDSKRFIFVNDSIIADQWSTPNGRKRLTEDYEVDAYVNLVISGQPDNFLYTVRLLGPGLENLLSETETVPRSWIASNGADDLKEKERKLIFRVLNRYPLDVYVTSLQGRYITLSSGKDQNIFDGDELTIVDVAVKNRHPVDGSWLLFDQKVLGKAKIVESKGQSSIAQITSLNSENAIRVGSGARVDAIASRRLFQDKPKESESFVSVDDNSPIVVPKGSEAPKPGPLPNTVAIPKMEAKAPKFAQAETSSDKVPLPSAADNPAVTGGARLAQDGEEPPENQASGSAMNALLPFNFRNVRFSIEAENLNYGGTSSMSAKLPAFLINRLGLWADTDISDDLLVTSNLYLRSGDTKKGSYTGFGVAAEALFKVPLVSGTIPSLERLLFGGLAQIESVGSSGVSFGGWDVLQLGPVIHLQGSQHIAELIQTFDYDFSARYIPFASGTAGIKGKTRDFDKGSQTEFLGQVVKKGHTDELEWGGLVGLSQGSWELSKGKVSQNSLRIGLLGRMKM